MSLTLSQLRDEVRLNLKRDSTVLPDSRLTRWLNQAQLELAQLRSWEEMREIYETSTVSGQFRYAFPVRAKEFFSIRLLDGTTYRKLIYIPSRDADRYLEDSASSGVPEVYIDYGSNFELYPIPDGVYELRARISQFPVELSADSDTSALRNKDLLLVAGATILGLQSLKEVEDANYWRASVYAPMLQAAVAADHRGDDWDAQLQPFTLGPSFPEDPHSVWAGIRR